MTLKVRFRSKAERDLLEAARYYESKRESLGLEFLARIDNTVGLIGDHPQFFPVCFSTIRRALVKQFPYALYYQIENDVVAVGAVLHQRKNVFLSALSNKG